MKKRAYGSQYSLHPSLLKNKTSTLLSGGFFIIFSFVVLLALDPTRVLSATTSTTLPLYYTFNSSGVLNETSTLANSSSAYFWVSSGGQLQIVNGAGGTIQGALPSTDSWYQVYKTRSPSSTDGGAHPQNVFMMFARNPVQNVSVQLYINRVVDNLANSANRHSYNGESLLARYQDANNYYYAGIRADGGVVIKKKTNGVYQTLASGTLFSGTYNATTNPDLIPLGKWIGLKLTVTNNASGTPALALYTDVGQTGSWKLALTVLDDPAKYGAAITKAGLTGIQSDYADAKFDNFLLQDMTPVVSPPPPPPPPACTPNWTCGAWTTCSGGTQTRTCTDQNSCGVTTGKPTTSQSCTVTPPPPPPPPAPAPVTYDATVLADNPVMYLRMASSSSGTEQDKSGHGNNATYHGTPLSVAMPNGDTAADFNGSNQYASVVSSPALSIPTTHEFTYEAWIRPDVLQFPNQSSDGYIDWIGKCQNYSPTCEWEGRMYSQTTPQGRENRISGYVFNPSAGLGSAADWQPASGLLKAGQWLHVVVEYQTLTTPAGCSSAYPGSINIWVNGIKQSFADHAPTGCMSQFSVIPKAGSSPLTIGTMALDTWFKGAVGKVAVYNKLLTQTQINSHFTAMTGATPSGSCGATCTALMVSP